jgi:hypothetical protein
MTVLALAIWCAAALLLGAAAMGNFPFRVNTLNR